LFGCAGCFAIGVLGIVIAGVMVGRSLRDVAAKIGPITPQNMQQKLGDIPLYPNGTLDEAATKGAYTGVGMMSGLFKGKFELTAAASMRTNDSPEQIFKFYDSAMRQRNWIARGSSDTGFIQQYQYQRGNDMAMVQVQSQLGTRIVSITRMHIQVPGRNPGPAPRSPNLQPAQ
jgi:hypothetical protein